MKVMLLILGIVLAGEGCARESGQQSRAKQTEKLPRSQSVKVVAVKSQVLNTQISLPAQIVPYQVVDIYPKVTGFIDNIRVDRGSQVRHGEVLMRLSAPELLAQRAQSEATVQAAEARLAAAQAKFVADQGTYLHLAAAAKTPGVVAGNDLLAAEQTGAADRAQIEAASNNVRAAKDALHAVMQLEDYLVIRAPFDGVVTARNLHPGALVGPASGQGGSPPVLQIEDLRRLRLVVPVPEAYVGDLKTGQQVAFSVPAYPGHVFHSLSHNINQNTRTMAVELDVRNSDGSIAPGTFANVVWPIRRAYSTLFVPSTAITTDQQRTFVIRVRDGKTEWVDVNVGTTASTNIEVFGDLKAGDQVIYNATDSIRPGTQVSVQVP